MPELSIIIVNYNQTAHTVNCIESIVSHTKAVEYEIILIDNGSIKAFKEAFPPNYPVRIFRSDVNLGFARANNLGIDQAKADTVLLLNNDTLVLGDAIGASYDELWRIPEVGMLGCRLLNEDGSDQISSFIPVRFPLLNLFINTNTLASQALRRFGWLSYYSDHLNAIRNCQQQSHFCEGISGAFMMFKRQLVEPYGFFDPDFFLYCEEIEWCRNRLLPHMKILYYRDASVTHLSGKSSESTFVEKQTLLSGFLYSYKKGWFTFFIRIVIYCVNTLTNIPCLPFMKAMNRRLTWNSTKNFIVILPQILFDITRYSPRFGSRREPLRVR